MNLHLIGLLFVALMVTALIIQLLEDNNDDHIERDDW